MPAEREKPLDQVRRLVVGALRDPAGVLALPPRELDLTIRLLRRARLLGRLAADLQALGRLDSLRAVIADPLYSALVVADARARVARWELDRIAWALRDMPEVPLVALKGCAYLLAGTPNARGRTFADVDLLVPEADLARVEAQLRAAGWGSAELTPYDERYYRVWAHEIPPLSHPERGVEVDLHHNILMRTARLKPSAELLLEASRPVPGSRFRLLAPVDMTLHAITHLFYGGEMDDAVRELVDISELLPYFGEAEAGFWDGFWRRAEALDLARPAYYGLRYARELLAAGVSEPLMGASGAVAPWVPARTLMDSLVPLALFPRHPDGPKGWSERARQALYVRSHWVKMPPGMLLRHLIVKAARQRDRSK